MSIDLRTTENGTTECQQPFDRNKQEQCEFWHPSRGGSQCTYVRHEQFCTYHPLFAKALKEGG